MPIKDQIFIGYFLVSNKPSSALAEWNKEWDNQIHLTIEEKIQWVKSAYPFQDIFPWQEDLSEGIDATAFNLSHLIQPLLFLRVRPGKQNKVQQQVKSIGHQWINDSCIAVDNTTSLQGVVNINEDVVIQDRSSQEVGGVLQKISLPPHASVWDCCAASGGKSILATDIFGPIQLSVSDIRSSILKNLRGRLMEAGVPVVSAMVKDMTKPIAASDLNYFDCVIADVPCSGSGTWGRTPEQLYFFEHTQINEFAQLQKSILLQAAKGVKPGGYFVYITCSVFKQENELQINAFLQNSGWERVHQQLLSGYQHRADTLFVALLRKPL